MSIYLHDIPLIQANDTFSRALQTRNLTGICGEETIPLDENAVGRVLSKPVYAIISSPHYHAAAMDGFAVKAQDTAFAMQTTPKILDVPAQVCYLDTGDPLPDWADAVMPIEQVEALNEYGQLTQDWRAPAKIRIRTALTPWSHVRALGEDVVATQLVLPAGQILSPFHLGAAAASGNSCITVSRRPRVAILPTGSELTPIGMEINKGDIIEFNSIIMAAQVNQWGGLAVRYPIIPDDQEKLCCQVRSCLEQFDLILINAGSSAGSEDLTAQVIADLGEVLVHGVAVRPGHPVILGFIHRLDDSYVPVIGVPGYPVSTALTMEIFVEPLIAQWLGRMPWQPIEISAQITKKITSSPGDDDYLRVVVGKVGEKVLAAPLPRGAGVISSLSRADGIIIIPSGLQGLEARADVKVRLYNSPKGLDNTVFMTGSHDMTLDLLAQFLTKYNRRLVSSNVGSLGGLLAVRNGETHMAGSHLFDADSGTYNITYIQNYLPTIPVKLMSWVKREQGLIVAKRNPKSIHSFMDLIRDDIRFMNRQKGAGTRIFLDYNLKILGIQSDQIQGYRQEEYTHLGVAAAVASNRADCGLGIKAAAISLDLDFIPLANEQYDLIIPQHFFSDELLAPVFALTQDPGFRAAVSQMPGYDVSQMGTVCA